jgi:hypothetical protein
MEAATLGGSLPDRNEFRKTGNELGWRFWPQYSATWRGVPQNLPFSPNASISSGVDMRDLVVPGLRPLFKLAIAALKASITYIAVTREV